MNIYTVNKEDIESFARFVNADTKLKGDELQFKRCPYCGGGRDDEWTFAINIEKGVYKCLRSSCGAQGHFVELCRDFGYKLFEETPRIYRKLVQPTEEIEPRGEALQYLEHRGIGYLVAKRYEITTRTDNRDILAFPFRDEKGELVLIKYRDTKFNKNDPVKRRKGKEWSEDDCKPILFGMYQCRNFDRLVITEGQLDSLSVAQAGIDNAVSVPNGCNGFTWLPFCLDWIKKFKEVVVFGDCEHGKITLIDYLRTRLPQKVKCVRVEDYLGEKDANDILRKYGADAVRTAVNNAVVPKLDNVKDLSTVKSVNLESLPKIKTEIKELDKLLSGGMYLGQVVLLTGKRGDGKSTFMSQLVANALNEGETVFVYSGELADFHFKRWLDLQLCGKDNLNIETDQDGIDIAEISDETQKRIDDWYRGRAFIYDNDYIPESKSEFQTLTETIERVIKTYNARLICLDNLMTAMSGFTNARDIWLQQSSFVGDLKKIATKYQVVIILVAHPRKSNADFQNDDVSGSADITNKVDIVMNYARPTSDDKDDSYDSMLMVTKNRLGGELCPDKDKAIKFVFSTVSKQIHAKYDVKAGHYSWESLPDVPEDIKLPW